MRGPAIIPCLPQRVGGRAGPRTNRQLAAAFRLLRGGCGNQKITLCAGDEENHRADHAFCAFRMRKLCARSKPPSGCDDALRSSGLFHRGGWRHHRKGDRCRFACRGDGKPAGMVRSPRRVYERPRLAQGGEWMSAMTIILEIAAGVFLGTLAVTAFCAWLPDYLEDRDYKKKYRKVTGRSPW
jgi:hypothetical protein